MAETKAEEEASERAYEDQEVGERDRLRFGEGEDNNEDGEDESPAANASCITEGDSDGHDEGCSYL